MEVNNSSKNKYFDDYSASRGPSYNTRRYNYEMGIRDNGQDTNKILNNIKQQQELYKMKANAIYSKYKKTNEEPIVNTYA